MVKWWIMTSFTRFTFLSTEILQRLSRGANTQRPMCWKERKEPLSVFVTLNPGSLCPLFFSFLVFASEKLSLFFFFSFPPLKQLHEIQDQFFLMGIEGQQRQWLQKWSLLEAIGSFVRLEKNNPVPGKKKKEQSQQGGFWFMPLFAHPQILFWVGISHVSGGTLCSFQFCETPRAGRSSWRLVGIFSFIETNAVMGEVWTQFYFVFQRGFVCANLTSWTVLQIPVGWYLWYWCIVPTINDAVIEPNTKSVVLNWVLVSAVSF